MRLPHVILSMMGKKATQCIENGEKEQAENFHSHSKPNKTFTAHKVKCDFHLDSESASF